MTEPRKAIAMKVTDAERALFTAAAKEKGLPMTAWIRMVATDAAKAALKGKK